MKWQLRDANGRVVGSLSAVRSITYASRACNSFSVGADGGVAAASAGGVGVRDDAGSQQYVFDWATPSARGCYALLLALDSGQVLPAYFSLS